MKKGMVSRGFALALCLLLLAAGVAFGQAKIELKYAVVYPPVGAQADGAAALAKFIDQYSNGRLEMKFYPSSQLGDKMPTLQALREGSIEMSECAASDLSNFDKLWSVFSLPFTFNNGEDAIKILNSPTVAKILNDSAEAAGFKIIAWWNMGERSVLNAKRPINKPADLKGIKIRVMQDPVLAKAIGAMGAIGVPMAWGEVYSAVQQKVLDGLENSPPVITANKLQEVAKYYSLTQQFIIPDPQLISLKVFNGLPADLQDAIVKAGQASQAQFSQLWAKAVDKEYATLKAAGVKINEVDKAAFRTAVKPMVDEYLAGADPKVKQLYAAFMAAKK
jgi:tripartite ATP-independent transporter DctP family solute receptor